MWAELSCFLSRGDGYVGELLELQQGCEGPLEFQMLDVINLETPHWKWASSRLEERTPWIFLSCGGALDLRRGPQGPALVASGKASPHASYSGASRGLLGFPLLLMLGPKTLCGVSAGT